ERDKVRKAGWRYEGIGWQAPKSGTPVYRLYNPNAGDHHYTPHVSEKNNLVKVGWRYEGISWYSPSSGTPLYRLYN
nr:mannosyl-glycoprotein endo-beta-N-acetylglucosamidase [Enterococcus faecalis]